ncbi:FAD/NAD(P)-binding domain-containing protein [Cryphonectria parasitica EP155]|uniref:Kynurenine 3-monooxygenase n=1 Tax=Cryphonectria parasitica (strain ATCC 38755 / EP155) TaxID=660469 RepID=A0A9P4Y189_CRYP1|nr:FAD/NAD(P)-binding domain-containing protein [Cryphonectria parasitica EP155]KAF3764654.1 FAD/NAD(P)-binding domain-containing protein [Cryphonectria parasitica EP155]
MSSSTKVVVVGAGPVGSLAALYAAQRGHDVEIYELRNDLRDPSTVPLNFTKSINLALSVRGITAMEHAEPNTPEGERKLLDYVLAATIPMRGRMIHGRKADGDLYEESQDYDVHGRTIFAVDRGGLNKRLLDVLEAMPNVKLFFNHKLTGADFRRRKAWFEKRNGTRSDGRPQEIEIDFDLMLGADGAHSAVRYHMMKYTRMDYEQRYIDTLWCEFQIQPKEGHQNVDPMSQFKISPNHLHIWPGKEFMFIAIPSEDGTFTCTLFAPGQQYAYLESNPTNIPSFFDQHFPGVTALIPPEELIASFEGNPHLPLITIKCKPHHFSSSVVLLGDAAHAMVPFYGQGMNAGLEDVRTLFTFLDRFPATDWAKALDEYTAHRVPDAHSINDLALQNYTEMRASVLSPAYRLRKFLEESLSKYLPSLGWQTKYSRVSFSNERYSEVIARSEHQGKMLMRTFFGAVGLPALVGAAVVWVRYRKVAETGLSAIFEAVAGPFRR